MLLLTVSDVVDYIKEVQKLMCTPDYLIAEQCTNSGVVFRIEQFCSFDFQIDNSF